MFAKYLKMVMCVFVVMLLLPFASSFVGIGPEFESAIDGAAGAEDEAAGALVMTPVAAPKLTGSRAMYNYQQTNSNDPNEGATRFSESGDQLAGEVKNGRIHWFMTTAFQIPPPTGKPYNITINPSVSFGSNDWILVRLYVFWDYNYDNYIDEKELVLLHQESYSGSSSTHQKCWGLTSREGDYYIGIEGRPNNPTSALRYTLTVTWSPQDPETGDINYDITKALPITKNTALPPQYIDMDLQPFDWYVIDAPTDSQMFGINVTVRLKINSPIPPLYSGPIGTTFVTELLVVLIHEKALDPEGDKVFGGIGNASKHSTTGLPKSIWYYNVITWEDFPEDRISRTYIGVYATTYGIDKTTREHRFYDLDVTDDIEDDYVNSYTHYSFIKVNSEPVIRPIIKKVKTYSLRTNTATGKTYDQFQYQCEYYSKANYAPLIFRVYIYPPDPTRAVIIRDMKPRDPSNTNFVTSPEFIYTIDGLELGQGCFKYQIDCWDRHTYATGSKADKVVYDGPCVENNIPPQVRDTAPDTLEMMEDDKPITIYLRDYFIDVDGDDITFFLIDDEGNSTTFYEPDDPENKILNAKIDKTKLIITPLPNKFGNCFITIVGSDFPEEVNATLKLEVVISPVNDPPQIKNKFRKLFLFGEIWFYEDTNYTDLNLHDVFWDPIEWDPLTFTVSGNENVLVSIAENGTVRFTAKPNWHGMEVLTFTATDPPGGFVSDELKVSLYSVNDAPILNQSPPIICYEEAWTNITFDAWDPADNDPLVFTSNIALALNLKPEDYEFNKDTGELNFYPPNRVATGKGYNVTVWVYDLPSFDKSITVSMEVTFIIRNKWDAPIPKIVQPVNGDIFLHYETIEFIGMCLDDDLKVPDLNEKITFEWYSDLDGKFGDTDVVRNVMLSPGTSGQQHTITLKVSDGKYQDSTKIKIWVVKEERKDSDGDGMPDFWEDRNHLNKFDPSDADGDPDQDNFTNLQEYLGDDGIGETPPYYDPWDPKSRPEKVDIPPKEEEFDVLWPGVGLMIVILIMAICIMLTLSFISRRVRDARDYSERRRELEERIRKEEREKEEARYGIYSSESDLDVLCHSCGTRNKVHSKLRPLAVRCEKCDQRGVIY